MKCNVIRKWPVLALLLGVAGGIVARAEQVVLSEVHYHPRPGHPEFVEVYNNTATPFDIAEWSLEGGARYTFPAFDAAAPGLTFLNPFERIVLTGDDPARTRAVYAIPAGIRVYGPWVGNLSDAGERVTLKDKNGVIVCTVAYGDSGRWPASADGAGHSLVLVNPDREVDDYRNWAASRRAGGTPGTVPAAAAETPVPSPELNLGEGLPVVDFGDSWRYHDRSVDLGTAWRDAGYDDSGWASGPGLFGFETAPLPAPGLRTGFTDSDQVTFYLRKAFVYSGPLQNAVMTVDQVIDDGAVYYLNGQEMGRSGMAAGAAGYVATANRTVGDATVETNVFPVASSLLRNGTNVLAVEVHQSGPTSSDLVFGMRLKVTTPRPAPSGVVINEVLPGGPGVGFVEFFNGGTATVDLGGFHLTDSPGNLTRHRIPGPLPVAPGGWVSVGFVESGLAITNPVSVYLVAPDGQTVENALSATMAPDGRSLGRKPAGGASWFLFAEPTREGPNVSQEALLGAARLNEVHGGPAGTVDWVELVNRSTNALSLDGFRLASRRDFADALPLAGVLPAGGFVSVDAAFPVVDGEVTLYLVGGGGSVADAEVFRFVVGRPSEQAFPDGSGEWYASATSTRNGPNAPERVTAVVINEIMFDPPSDQLDGEYVELFNRGTTAVDLSGWRFDAGIDFDFPAGTVLAPGAYLVVAANRDHLLRAHGAIPVVGNFGGRLSNRGEWLRLVDAAGNLVDAVDYRSGGDWPERVQGNGSSLELVHPALDNSLGSAWRDSDESGKTRFQSFSVVDTYRQQNSLGGVTDYRELHFHLAGDGHVVLENIAIEPEAGGTNLLVNAALQSTNQFGASGWLCQGTHWASGVTNGQLHLISDGHGDNRANRVELDATNLVAGVRYRLSFNARWIWGTPRLIAQTWDHSLGAAFVVPIPENLGTPGAPNTASRSAPPPQLEGLRHQPAVPRSSQDVTVTARVHSADPVASVILWHRADSANNDGVWASKPMFDDGQQGGDAVAGDGVYTARLTEYRVNGRVVQFYVRATTAAGGAHLIPRRGAEWPALYVVDDQTVLRDLRVGRFVISAYDTGAISSGETAKYAYRFPRLSNHYFNMTFISNEEEIYYGGEIRNSGSPWTRSGDLSRGKWKLPGDRRFRGHEKFTYDNDPTAGRMHHNRITRYWLYLLGHPVNENEFIRVIINSGAPGLREDTEPLGNDLLDRLFENGSNGELYRIDDEWWFRDTWEHNSRNADWSYKSSDNPVRYHSEWMKRSREDDYDYSALINLFYTVSRTAYTQEQIERLVDAEAMLKMAAVRGYIQDWDSFTLDRGKNGYLYRRWDDGKFMFMHWDSDLAFGSATGSLYNGSRPGIGPWLSKPYNLRRFYAYLAEMLDQHTRGSARMEAWLQAEEAANNSFAVASGTYRSWFTNRYNYIRGVMGTNYTRPLEISTNGGQPVTTAEEVFSLTGLAPYAAYTVRVAGHPEAVATWNGLNAWTLSGIRLRSGVNVLVVEGVDPNGRVTRTATLEVTKTGSAAPVLELEADPGSWNVPVEGALRLDGRGSRDPEGTALTFAWTAPTNLAAFAAPTPATAVATFTRPGLYEFTLAATDAAGVGGSITREAAVYGTDGFSSFGAVRLEPFWALEGLDYRGNSPNTPWLSLTEYPGHLTLQVPDDMARPWITDAPSYPFVWRTLPSTGDWVWQARLALASRQFGNFLAGLGVETVEGGVTNRHLFGVENGTALTATRVDGIGGATSWGSVVLGDEEVVIRIRRSGATLGFEQRVDEVWNRLFSAALAPGAVVQRGGLLVATAQAQSIRIRADYAMVIDPSNLSELRLNLRIAEVMYNPPGGDAYEYVELVNVGGAPLDLTGVRFIEGIDFTFGAETLAPGERLVVVKDPVAFGARYAPGGARVAAGAFTGRLADGGERLTLADPAGNLILSFEYGDGGDWPGRADGLGSSLQVRDPRGDYEDPANWQASGEYLGSPGRAAGMPPGQVVINEVLTHTDPPLEDAVELYNSGTNTVDLGGWFLSDDGAVLTKFRIPSGTILPPGGFAVFYEFQFNDTNSVVGVPFSFDSAYGDDVWLTAADAAGNPTWFIDRADFGAAENGVPFGLHPNGVGQFVPLASRTFGSEPPADFRAGRGASNAPPRVGPLVLNQIQYHPAEGDDEYLELLNITSGALALFDPLHPTNTWRVAGGVDFTFPTNILLAAGETVLVVPTDPATFRSRHGIPAEVQVFGPYVGALDNNGERVSLFKPDRPQTGPLDAGYVPQILVERVEYDDAPPWPELADGWGAALRRRDPSSFGNDPANWYTDLDRDGMADDWEVGYFLSPFYEGDAGVDLDGDGWTNLEEFRNGTDPRVAPPVLQIRNLRVEGGDLVFEFDAQADQSYSVVSRDAVAAGAWNSVRQVAADPAARVVEVREPLAPAAPARYYQIVSPQLP